ncbi:MULTISPECIES: hypothetical protein [unclassified Crossiella]|uniref:hypothetical protein n=1 Tax=unclassified Crossiella TaxID=2620835 RepID=UPI001FFF2F03|nr:MULTISPECIES: hypothetical protein [unclassified Crossiella]MCK2241835.1 hypothetical protein [Crossiella sp. S99.2]MCK2255738.1 hypothetical protein [Crossiella sp. S99.1]
MTINVGAGRPVFKVTKIGKGGVDFSLSYPTGTRATLTLDKVGAFALFGEFKITQSEWDGNGLAEVEVATK